uniref:Uncharacterized protein n=1 Tax=Nelumbo nucifera TaxID=4432 RepID=A0A822ZA48_NELNU|nr:TPA_asm: hypothetical protein HUJ06_014229 [Nelumbo nucifera]
MKILGFQEEKPEITRANLKKKKENRKKEKDGGKREREVEGGRGQGQFLFSSPLPICFIPLHPSPSNA